MNILQVFIDSPVNGHLGFVHFLSFMNKAVKNFRDFNLTFIILSEVVHFHCIYLPVVISL